ncbi:hypothetical protein SDC9_102355 [bioreactor metagenome]|uniref:Uncharacterized protein n=1 Tax=bioreactor metagenome TaxID=1076179 RepID=A0A645AS16_9ZZZZ
MAMNAGKLDQLVRVLELGAVEGGFGWVERRKAWAHAELSDRTNIFSSAGLGARTVVFTIRRQSIDLDCAIQWGTQHCFITAITPTADKVHLTVTAAVVLSAAATDDSGRSFPCCLTEKYAGYERDKAHSEVTVRYVLVLPKSVTLAPGDLVTLPGYGRFEVHTPHELDGHKNEYEAERTADA